MMKSLYMKGLLAAGTVACTMSFGTVMAHADEKELTLCWAAWDPANALVELSKDLTKPLIACWMGEEHTRAAREYLSAHNIPVFRMPESSVINIKNCSFRITANIEIDIATGVPIGIPVSELERVLPEKPIALLSFACNCATICLLICPA